MAVVRSSGLRWGCWCCWTLLTLGIARSAWTGDSGDRPTAVAQADKKKAKAAQPPAKTQPPKITPEQETAVLAFVEQHHPELSVLLAHLKENNHPEYDRAIRDIFRTSERLAQTRQRDDRRYDLELRQWQNQSRIDLLSARLKMANSDEYREQLRGLLAERIDLKAAVLQLERERVSDRLRKLEQQLGTLQANRESQIDNQMRTILGSAKPAARPRDKAKKPATSSDKP